MLLPHQYWLKALRAMTKMMTTKNSLTYMSNELVDEVRRDG